LSAYNYYVQALKYSKFHLSRTVTDAQLHLTSLIGISYVKLVAVININYCSVWTSQQHAIDFRLWFKMCSSHASVYEICSILVISSLDRFNLV